MELVSMTLNDGVTTITLPDDLEWVDEYNWSSVLQDIQPLIGGGLIISESSSTKGRPVTLVSGEQVWVNKSVVDSLMTLVNTVGKTYTLTLPDARTLQVVFDRKSGNPVDATPVWRRTVQVPDSPYILALKLMEV